MDNQSCSLVLQSGGTRGICHLGVIEAIQDSGWKINAVSGTSVGALNAAGLASGRFRELSYLWHTQTPQKNLLNSYNSFGLFKALYNEFFTKRANQSIAKGSLRKNDRIRSAIDIITEDDLIQSSIKSVFSYISTVDNQLKRIYSNEKNRNILKDSILASCAIPYLLPPVKLANGDIGIDGALIDSVPVAAILPIAGNSDKIIIVLSGDIDSLNEDNEVKNFRDYSFKLYTIMMKTIEKFNIEAGKSEYWYKKDRFIIIEPKDHKLVPHSLEWDQKKLIAYRKHFYEITLDALKNNQNLTSL